MPFQFRNFEPEQSETVTVLKVEIAVIDSLDSLPVGLQAKASNLLRQLSTGAIGFEEWALRMLCLSSERNPKILDRLKYEDLEKMQLHKDDVAELGKAAGEVVKPLIQKLSEQLTKPDEGDTGNARKPRARKLS